MISLTSLKNGKIFSFFFFWFPVLAVSGGCVQTPRPYAHSCFFFGCSKIEGSLATARQTAELLRSVISQQRVPYTNQARALIDAVRAVGEQLIAANPVGMCKD